MTQLALTNEKINSYGELTLSGRLLSKFCRIENYFKDPKGSRSDRISNTDILTSMIGLLVQGRTHYEDIELFRQDEIKSDMGIERFPSNNYGVNQLFLALGAIAYNILRAIDSRAMKLRELWPQHLRNRSVRLQRRRVGSVMRDLISVACKVVSHAGRKTIKIARCWPWSRVLISIDRQLA